MVSPKLKKSFSSLSSLRIRPLCYSVNNSASNITMTFKLNTVFYFTTIFCIQAFGSAQAKPFPPGCGYESFEGGFPIGREFSCGPISPPISFLPVPQPVPVRVPQPQKQSVTIPNIILALLPPNQKPPYAPRPVVRSPPVVLPLPQPYPLPIVERERCGCY